MKKKVLSLLLAVVIIATFGVFALASGDDDSKSSSESKGKATTSEKEENVIGDYTVDIAEARLAKDYSGKDVVIIKYMFTNNAKKEESFTLAIDDNVYQNNIGLNNSYILSDDANYSADNQTKEIKPGATLDVEVAYELNDTTTDVLVEVAPLFTLKDDEKISKTFTIS